MVSMFLTLIVIGTFYKVYNNSLKSEKRTSSKTSVVVTGERIINTIADPLKLLGLANVFEVDGGGDWLANSIIVDSDGAANSGDVTFGFRSPYGGFVSKLMNTASGDVGSGGSCEFKISYTTSLSSEANQKVNLFSSNGIYSATLNSVDWEQSQLKINDLKDSNGDAISGSCGAFFPLGSLITGPNYYYKISYLETNGGSIKLERYNDLADTSPQTVLDFKSVDNSYSIPLFILEFLREYEDTSTGVLEKVKEWVESPTADELRDVKAVRVGFVLLADKDRNVNTGTGLSAIDADYCPFTGKDVQCYTLTNPNKNAFVFGRVVYLKNFDYLRKSSL